jgi:4-amino-4-deoxy-L-arabinose transferase-like glycosyltransferase
MGKKGEEIHAISNVTERLAFLSNKYFYLLLWATISLALILRIAALFSLKNSVYFDFLLWDERLYHVYAAKIADGSYQSTSVYEFAPLPAYLMAIIYKLFSPNILYIRITNIIFGVLTCYLVYLIGKEMTNRTVGLFACIIASLYKPFIFYSIVPLKTSLSLFLFASAIYLLVAILNEHSMIKIFLLGLAGGLMFNVRGNYGILIPVILLIILLNLYHEQRGHLKTLSLPFLLFIAGLSLSTSPFIVRNYKAAGKFVLTASQAGFNLYLGNNLQNPDPYYRPVPFASASPFKQGVQFTIEASRRSHKKLSPREASSYWSLEVVNTALEQPAAFIWKLVQKTLAFFNQFEAGDHYHIGFISDFVGFFKFPFFSLWLIFPFGMAGMMISVLSSKKLLALHAIFFLYALTLILFFTNTRYRLPLLVILIPFAVIGINCLASILQQRQLKNIAIYASIFIAFLIVEFLPIRGSDDVSAYYNTHAIILDVKGLKDQAIEYWERSSEMNKPPSAYANLALAGKYLIKRDVKKAAFYLDKIPKDSFAAAAKYEMIGDMLVLQGHTERAIAAYQRSLAINSGQRKPRLKLIRIYDIFDRERALRERERFQYISSFYTML